MITEQDAKKAEAAYNRLVHQNKSIAQENYNTEWKSVNGLGQKVASISRDEYLLARQIYGDFCWDDPDFVKAWIRDNPACRIKTTRGTRGQELVH